MLIRIIVFYGATFLFTIILGGAQQAADLRGSEVILPQLAPGLAAGLMLLLFRGDHHRISLIDRRIPGSRYLLAVAIPAAGGLAVYFVARLLAMPQVAGTSASTPWALLLWMPIGAIGEELGWRGYLHKRLDPVAAALASSIVVGILWALWHVGMYANGPAYMAFFVLLMVGYSVAIYALVADRGFNLALAAIFHLVVNITNLLSFASVSTVGYIAVSSLVWLAIAGFMVLARWGAFSSRPRA